MRIVFLALVLFITCQTVLGQTFMHGAGLNVFLTSAKTNDTHISEGFSYSPRINFVETGTSSVSIGIPLTVGFSVSGGYNSYAEDEAAIGFFINAPLIVNLNIGRGSTKENLNKFGYFAGGGFGYHYGTFISTVYDDHSFTYDIFGPAANAGVRIGVGEKHKNIEIKLSFMKGINENKPNIFGLGCLFNF